MLPSSASSLTDSHHEFKELKEVEEKITSSFQALLKAVNAKKQQFLTADKEAWKGVESVEEECMEWIRKTEEVRDGQVMQMVDFIHFFQFLWFCAN